jgi:hypothetical protein
MFAFLEPWHACDDPQTPSSASLRRKRIRFSLLGSRRDALSAVQALTPHSSSQLAETVGQALHCAFTAGDVSVRCRH